MQVAFQAQLKADDRVAATRKLRMALRDLASDEFDTCQLDARSRGTGTQYIAESCTRGCEYHGRGVQHTTMRMNDLACVHAGVRREAQPTLTRQPREFRRLDSDNGMPAWS